MKRILTSALVAAAAFVAVKNNALSQAFTENFDDITTLAGSGWATINNSSSIGLIPNWFQGTSVSGGGPFDSYNGAANAYIAANYNFTTGSSTIDGWLITPNRTFRNGDVLTFYTSKATPDTYADRLEVRLSTNGASTNVGTTGTTGDFTTLLLSVNPSLVTGVYPTTWTQYTITLSGLPAPTSGRMAFRYFVTSGGPTGSNSDYIGIDNVVYTPYVCPTFTMTAAGALSGGTAGSSYSTVLTQTGALGAPNFAITSGALPPGITLASDGTISGTPTATGTFNFTATVSDASGCSGSTAYSITVVCGSNPIAFSTPPSLCTNGSIYTLTEGMPAGGTYSGTGVSGSDFDPATGTQTISYDYTDPYGCSYTSSYSITVNTPTTAAIDPVSSLCDNGTTVTLTANPAGGVFSGTGVSGDLFDPSAGSQTVTYVYTDVNSCNDTATAVIDVNVAPTVTLGSFSDACSNHGAVVLSGGMPAGGTYSGTGVSGGSFDPSSGTQSITYDYTDANGCSGSAVQQITVNDAPTVSVTLATNTLCSNASAVTLSGGIPAGGTYSGTGVSGGSFDPSSGTQSITYDYTDANGCSGSAVQQITVNDAPTVSVTLATDTLCSNASAVTLSGGIPAGGTYSGTGVSAGTFNPGTSGTGNFTISYDYTDGNGCSASSSDMIAVISCLGLDELSQIVNIYPNPSGGLFTLVANETIDFSVLDCTGKYIVSGSAVSGMETLIDLKNCQSGVYFLSIEGTPIKKLMKL